MKPIIPTTIILSMMISLALPLTMPSINAEVQYQNRCYGNVLAREANLTIGSTTYPINNTIPCQYGCDANTNQCKQPAFYGWVTVFMVVVAIFAITGIIFKYG